MGKIAGKLVNRTVRRLNNIVQSEETEEDRYQRLVQQRRAIKAEKEAERLDRMRESWYYTY